MSLHSIRQAGVCHAHETKLAQVLFRCGLDSVIRTVLLDDRSTQQSRLSPTNPCSDEEI